MEIRSLLDSRLRLSVSRRRLNTEATRRLRQIPLDKEDPISLDGINQGRISPAGALR